MYHDVVLYDVKYRNLDVAEEGSLPDLSSVLSKSAVRTTLTTVTSDSWNTWEEHLFLTIPNGGERYHAMALVYHNAMEGQIGFKSAPSSKWIVDQAHSSP